MANAGDMHFDDETHNVVYTIIDTNGNHVTGQTARLTVRSSDNINYWDWDDSNWEAFNSATTPHQTMTEDADGGFYWMTFTADNAVIASGDLVFIVSNDNATYADLQAESVSFSNLNNLIKIHR